MVSVVCLSVCRLSETFVFPTQRIKIFGNIFTRFRTLGIWGGPCKISRRSAQGNPSNEGVECKGYDKMTIFSQISRSITETVKVIDGTCSETICKHRILFRSIQHLAWLPQGRPQGKQKCGKYSCNITGNTCNITRNTCNITGNTCNIYTKHMQHYKRPRPLSASAEYTKPGIFVEKWHCPYSWPYPTHDWGSWPQPTHERQQTRGLWPRGVCPGVLVGHRRRQ